MTTAPAADAANTSGTDLQVLPPIEQSALARAPIFDSLNARQIQLLQAKSPLLSPAEIAMAMELAWAYQLDPYANEIWFTKGKGSDGKLLIMVGRDGLRKVVTRNGLELDCDVVREKDTFTVERGPDRSRVITHTYSGDDRARGEVVGAWAECYERATGKQRGFFYAPLSEYMPGNVSSYSPWAKQKSVMILAAAERQAARQGTPLGGLLIEGEDEVVNDVVGGRPVVELTDGDSLDVAHADEVAKVIARAKDLGHVGLGSVATAQMALAGQDEARVLAWIAEATRTLDQMEAQQADAAEVAEPAEVIDPDPVVDGEREPTLMERMKANPDGPGLLERLEEVRERIHEAEAADVRDEELLAELAAEHDAIQVELVESNDQPSLGL